MTVDKCFLSNFNPSKQRTMMIDINIYSANEY